MFADDTGVYGYTTIFCPKCKYKIEQHNLRHEKFKEVCKHPEKFINEVWRYMLGEAVKEPSHDECMLCGSIL